MSDFTLSRAPLPADQFTIISNAFQRGQLPVPLKAVARCLLGYMISLPNGWEVNRAQLDASVIEGRDAVTNALKELERTGYLARTKTSQGGQWVWTWAITDDPIVRPITESPSPESQGMVPTRENTTNPQVVAPTEIPSTGIQSVKEKTDLKKTEEKNTAAAAARASDKEATAGEYVSMNKRATLLAQEHYERLGKMGNVPAFMKIIRKALIHGYRDDHVNQVLAFIAEHNWTLTEERLANQLRGGARLPSSRPAPAQPRPAVYTGRTRLEM
jgi:hypothetical protein